MHTQRCTPEIPSIITAHADLKKKKKNCISNQSRLKLSECQRDEAPVNTELQ